MSHRSRILAPSTFVLALVATCLGLLATHGRPTPAAAAEGSTAVRTPFGGNGYNMTFDGRIFITRQDAWRAYVMRPESIGRDAAGFPDLSAAFSGGTLIQAGTNGENALAICETNADDTPYRCDASGTRDPGGALACYDVYVIDSNAESGENRMRRRHLFLMVRDPGTASADIERFEWRDSMEFLDSSLRGIEPTVTRDGRLLVWQGVRENDGNGDTLVYSYNSEPCALTGWPAPRDLREMHDDAHLRATYRLAASPLRAPDGTIYTGRIHAAYPWLFPNGDAISFTAAGMPCRGPEDPGGCGPRRNALSVMGYPTNFALAHIDGEVNPSTEDDVRLFFASPGPRAFSTIPATTGIDVWPFFGSNTQNYTEISFDDGLDGRYAGVWHMNESVNVAGELDRNHTPDTSGFFNTGRVVGNATFPGRNNGHVGKALVLDGTTGRVEIPHTASLNPVNAMTLELWVHPTAPVDCDDRNNYRYLIGKGGLGRGAYSIVLEESGQVQGRVRVAGEERNLVSTMSAPMGAWTHIAMIYDGPSGSMAFFINGVESGRTAYAPGPLDGSIDPLRVGGYLDSDACPDGNGSFAGVVDEVKLSNIVRYGPASELPDAGVPVVDVDAGGGPLPGTDGGRPPGPGVDAGVPRPGTDGGAAPRFDGAVPDGGGSETLDGGCSCAVPGASGAPRQAPLGALGFAGVIAVLSLRARRSARRARSAARRETHR